MAGPTEGRDPAIHVFQVPETKTWMAVTSTAMTIEKVDTNSEHPERRHQAMPIETHLKVGERAEFAKTIGETDVTLFSGLTGDFDPIHVNEEYAKSTAFGRRIAHGGLIMGLLSTCASMMSRRSVERGCKAVPVSIGYDKIRFTRPVFINDTITARYVIEEVDEAAGRSRSKVEIVNQAGEVCLVGSHVMKWVPRG
jgi:3-hydroxybutyryl-CoA dehydratase